MKIEDNLIILKNYIRRNGWILDFEDFAFEYYYNHLNIKLSLPKIQNDSGYPRMLMIFLKKVEKLNPEISKTAFFMLLKSQCKNIRQKYSKDKQEWILLEPNCKYHYSEIPEIYIPELYIFG